MSFRPHLMVEWWTSKSLTCMGATAFFLFFFLLSFHFSSLSSQFVILFRVSPLLFRISLPVTCAPTLLRLQKRKPWPKSVAGALHWVIKEAKSLAKSRTYPSNTHKHFTDFLTLFEFSFSPSPSTMICSASASPNFVPLLVPLLLLLFLLTYTLDCYLWQWTVTSRVQTNNPSVSWFVWVTGDESPERPHFTTIPSVQAIVSPDIALSFTPHGSLSSILNSLRFPLPLPSSSFYYSSSSSFFSSERLPSSPSPSPFTHSV